MRIASGLKLPSLCFLLPSFLLTKLTMANNILAYALLLIKLSFVVTNLLMPSKCQKPIIVKEPLPLLIPVNESGIFSCKALCVEINCTGLWIINDRQHNYDNEVNEHGMMSHFSNSHTHECTLTLTVNASESMNNTSIQCRYEAQFGNMNHIIAINSATVYLFVMPSSPVSPNPSISKNDTYLILLWSPPFLWPGQRIQHYNITLTIDDDGSIAHHMVVNTTSTNPLIEILFPSRLSSLQFNAQNTPSCITFAISPVSDGSASQPVQTINISDWVWSFPSGSEFTIPAVNISVLYKDDGAPALVEVYIQIPRTICNFSELDYTLILEDQQGNIMAEIIALPNPDSGVIEENVKLYLKENREYSLKVRVSSLSQTTASQKHVFDTHHLLRNSNSSTCNSSRTTTSKTYSLLLYMTLTSVFGTLTLVLLAAFVVMTVCLCIHRRKRLTEIKLNESKSRVYNAMVNNPIYDGDGPVYESVLAQFEGNTETELNMSQSEDTTDQQYDNLHMSLNDTARYSAPPTHLQYLYTNTASNSVNGPINTSASASISRATPGGMALKKNGQERNKLHLTVSLGGNDSSNTDVSPELIPTSRAAVAPADVDEPYIQ